MTLVEFISSVCKEVFAEEGLTDSKKTKTSISVTTSGSSSKLITENILRTMIQNGTVSQLNDKSRFTPLARDLWLEHKNKKS